MATKDEHSNGITVGLGTQVRLGERSTLSAEGGVTLRGPSGTATAQNGTYDPKTRLARLTGAVQMIINPIAIR